MSTQLIDSIIDEQAIKKQLDTLDAQLTKSTTNLAACAVQAKVFNDTFGNTKGINDIISSMDKYNQLITQSQKVQSDIIAIEKLRAENAVLLQKIEQQKIDTATKSAATTTKQANAEQVLLTAEKSLIETLNKSGISVDKLNVSKSQAASVNKLVTTINNSEKGSHEQLAAQYDLNYKAYNKLSAVQRDTTAGKAMQVSLKDQSEALGEMEGKLGNFKRQVGDYKNQILGALGANQGFIGNLANIALGAEKTGTSFASSAANGVKPFITAMKELMMNPIVAFLASIAAIFMLVKAAIDSNGEATNKLNQVLSPFKELLALVLNAFSELLVVLLNGVLVLESWANGLLSLIPGMDKIAEKSQRAIELEKEKQALTAKSRQLMVDEAKTHEQTTEAMNKSRQKDKYSVEQRLAWLKTADNAELTLNEQKVEHAKQTFELLKKEMENEGKSYSELTSEKKDAYMKAEADIYSAREEYFAKTRRLQSQEANLLLESQKDYIDNMTKKGNAEIESWKTSQNTANMNSKQKIAYEQEYANKVINLQKDMNAQRIADQIKNDADGLEKTKKTIDKKIRIQNEAWINEAGITKDEYNRRKELTLKTIADHQKAEEDKSKEGTDKKVKAIEDENSVLESQRVQDHQIAISEYESYQISLLQKNNDANLLRLKADNDTNNMTYEQKLKFDTEYFAQEQQDKQKVLDLQRKYNKITLDDYRIGIANLKSEQKIFSNQQADDMIKHYEKIIGEQSSYQTSSVKSNEDYSNKSLAYQQQITRELFEIQANADESLARLKYNNNQITITELNTTLNNIKAQRAALLESQKTASENDELSRSLAIAKQKSDTEIQISADKYAKGEINASKYEKELKEISEKGAIERLDVEIWEIENNLKNEKLNNSEKLKLQQDLDDKKAQKAQKVNEETIKKEKAVQKAIVELIKTSASAIQTITDDQFQYQLDKIDALKTANSDAADAETNVVAKKLASGVLNQKEADAQDAAITAQKELRDKQLDEQATQIKIKQAKFDKEMSAFNIFINTASAVTEALPNIPLSVIIGAMGAIELAAVLAKPLPQYALGTEDHPGGPALVGEVKPEMIRMPDNKIMKVDKPTIMNLPKHTKVFPDYDKALQEMAFDASIRSMHYNVPNIEINAYNDSLMRKQMGSLVNQTERQIGKLDKLNNLDKHLGNIANNTINLEKAINSIKKNRWVS